MFLGKMNKMFMRKNRTVIAIALFLLCFCIFHYMKPGFAYGQEGEFRPFGVGYKNKTVVPVWGVVIILAILCYLAVLQFC